MEALHRLVATAPSVWAPHASGAAASRATDARVRPVTKMQEVKKRGVGPMEMRIDQQNCLGRQMKEIHFVLQMVQQFHAQIRLHSQIRLLGKGKNFGSFFWSTVSSLAFALRMR